MSPFKLPEFPATALSEEDDHDRMTLTQELDHQLPTYKQSKRTVGRILLELKPLYCRPGCRGQWRQFLRSRGLAVSTANDLIRRYLRGDSVDDRSRNHHHPKQPPSVVTLKLPIGADQRDEFKAAIDKLGPDIAAQLIYAVVTQAAAQTDTPIRPDENKIEQKPTVHSQMTSAARSKAKPRVESAGSGRFQEVKPPSPPHHGSPRSQPKYAFSAGLAGLLNYFPSRLAKNRQREYPIAAKPGAESAESGRFQKETTSS